MTIYRKAHCKKNKINKLIFVKYFKERISLLWHFRPYISVSLSKAVLCIVDMMAVTSDLAMVCKYARMMI